MYKYIYIYTNDCKATQVERYFLTLFCVGPRRSLCRGPALALRARRSSPDALCVGPRRALCRAPALSVSGPGAVCVGTQHSLCRARCCLCRGPALFVSGRRSLCRGLALSLFLSLSASVPGTVLCQASARSVLGPRGALYRRTVSGPWRSRCRALCWAPARSVSSSLRRARRCLCRAPALSVSGHSLRVQSRYSLAICVGLGRAATCYPSDLRAFRA